MQSACRYSIRLAFASMVQHIGEKRSRLFFGVPKRSSASIQHHRDLYMLPSNIGGDLLPAVLFDFCLRLYNSNFEEIFQLPYECSQIFLPILEDFFIAFDFHKTCNVSPY